MNLSWLPRDQVSTAAAVACGVGDLVMTGELTLQAGIIGFILGLPGIVSIGPQNLRLLHAGLARAYPGATASTAFLSEILLVAACIGGIGLSLSAQPDAVALLQGAGAAFVAWSGIGTLRRRGSTAFGRADSSGRGCVSAILAMLRVTWLNPLAYIEVVLMLGIMTADDAMAGRLALGIGFLGASAIKFHGLAMVAHRFAVIFAAPNMRRRFDLVSGSLLLCIAALLAARSLAGT